MSSLSSHPIISLVSCILCGFSAGIMWPGTISITSPRLPDGGTTLFAMLARAGDPGGGFGPRLVGMVTRQSGDNLRTGMLTDGIFLLVMIIILVILDRNIKKAEKSPASGISFSAYTKITGTG